uniref:Mite allergen Eur m 3 n=1 Tax=Aceria tosichella TaxID=561515 RepID=A0A6G1SJU4_9ACAR
MPGLSGSLPWVVVLALLGSVSPCDDFKPARSKSNERILDSDYAKPGEFPFLVSLGFGKYNHSCGGVILDERYILTGAGCLGHRPREIKVRTGCHSLTRSSHNCKFTTVIAIYKVHEGYNGQTLENDIALIRTKESIPLNDIEGHGAIRAIQFAEDNADDLYEVDKELLVIGYGAPSCGSLNSSDFPKAARIMTDPLERCKRLSFYKDATIDGRNICAGKQLHNRKLGAHQWDWGGPLVEPGDEMKLVGIVGRTPKRCKELGTSIYYRVAPYIRWIEEAKESMAS